MLYIASLDDQVVPIYSGLFTAISHPLILRALYIDGDAYKFVYSYRLLFQWHWSTVSCLQFIWFPLKPTCLTHPHSQLRNIRLWIDCTSLWSDGWIFDWCWPFVCVWRVNNIFVSLQIYLFFPVRVIRTFARLAVNYLFLANEGVKESTELHLEPFNANQEQNDYEVTNQSFHT